MRPKWYSFRSLERLIRVGDVEGIKDYIRAGGNPSRTGIGGRSLLQEACAYKQIGVADRLVRSGASVIHLDDQHLDALQDALRYGHSRIPPFIEVPPKFGLPEGKVRSTDPRLRFALVELLIDRGAEVNPKKVERLRLGGFVLFKMPLQAAAALGDARLVEWLIERGAALDATDYYEVTALHDAVREGWPECVETLLRAGADPSPPAGVSRRNLLHLAVEAGAQKVSEYRREAMRRGEEPSELTVDEMCSRYEAVMDLLATAGLPLGGADAGGWSAWDSAAVNRAEDRLVAHMAAIGMDVNEPGLHGNVLHFIASIHPDPLEPLLRLVGTLRHLGADTGALDLEGRTPAELAAQRGLTSLAQCLS